MPWQLDQDLENKKSLITQAKVIFAVLFALEKREALDSLGGSGTAPLLEWSSGAVLSFSREPCSISESFRRTCPFGISYPANRIYFPRFFNSYNASQPSSRMHELQSRNIVRSRQIH